MRHKKMGNETREKHNKSFSLQVVSIGVSKQPRQLFAEMHSQVHRFELKVWIQTNSNAFRNAHSICENNSFACETQPTKPAKLTKSPEQGKLIKKIQRLQLLAMMKEAPFVCKSMLGVTQSNLHIAQLARQRIHTAVTR